MINNQQSTILRTLYIVFLAVCLSGNFVFAQEAQEWSNGERVLSVTQDMVVSFADKLNEKSDYPVYRNNTLFVPRVDTDEQVGLFQEGIFQFDLEINAWRLLDHQVRPAPNIFLLESDKVELIVRETLPTQVFLKVTGSFTNSCGALGRIDHRLKDNRFEVMIDVINSVPGDGPQACFMVVTPFEKIVPLPVFGLSAGDYEYSVNGEMTGSFELKNDNTL